jgi:hypothetical protein
MTYRNRHIGTIVVVATSAFLGQAAEVTDNSTQIT